MFTWMHLWRVSYVSALLVAVVVLASPNHSRAQRFGFNGVNGIPVGGMMGMGMGMGDGHGHGPDGHDGHGHGRMGMGIGMGQMGMGMGQWDMMGRWGPGRGLTG